MSDANKRPPDQPGSAPRPVYRFADFQIDTSCGQLRRDGDLVRVRNQSFDLLVLLLRERPGLVSRERIREELWRDVSVEFEAAINSIVRDLRRTLDDDARQPRFIETVTGRGYRFIADVVEERASKTVPTPAMRRRRPRSRSVAVVAAAMVVVTAIAAMTWLGRDAPADPHTLVVLPLEIRDPIVGAERLSRSIAEGVAVALNGARNLTVLAVPAPMARSTDEPYAAIDRARGLGAGRMIIGTVGAADGGLSIRVQLLDTGTRQILWGSQEIVDYDDIPGLVANLANDVADVIGCEFPRRYEYFRYARGSEQMLRSPELEAVAAAFATSPIGGQEVLDATERLVSAFPDDPQAHLLRLHALVDHHNYQFTDESAAAMRGGLDALEQVDPGNPNVDILDGFANPSLTDESLTLASHARIDSCLARTDISPALRAFALRASSRYLLHAAGDTTAALRCLKEAVKLDPADAWTYCFLADTYYQMGRIQEGIHAARFAVALAPDNYSYELLVRALGFAGRWAEAATLLHDYYATDRDQRTAGWYALTLHQSGNTERAYVIALEAEGIPTASPDEIVSGAIPLAAYWAASGDSERARRHLQTLCTHDSLSVVPSMARIVPELVETPMCVAVIENCEAD